MADNFKYDEPASGISIGSLDASGVHLQKALLVTDTNVVIPSDATNGLDVDVTRVSGIVHVDDNASTLSVDDGGGSLTVDGTVAVSGTVTVSGPLTDTQLRATAVPVSGTFFQATQPVSAASLPLPTGASTAAKQPALGSAGTPSADVISVQGVTGMTPIKVDGSGVTQPVSGTFWQATQPVSLSAVVHVDDNASTISVDDGAGSLTVDGTVAATQSGTWNVGTVSTVTNVVHVDDNSSTISIDDGAGSITVDGTVAATQSGTWTVTQQSITKGTQGSTGVSTQDLKDSGRTQINMFATAAAAGTTTTETAITLTKSSGTSATSTGTSFVVTNGKRFRITSITFATRGHATATIQTTTFSLRLNTAGAVVTTSTPILLQARSATPATASAWDRVIVPIPDGFEILGDGTLQIGVTAAATYTSNAPTWDVLITGFEY